MNCDRLKGTTPNVNGITIAVPGDLPDLRWAALSGRYPRSTQFRPSAVRAMEQSNALRARDEDRVVIRHVFRANQSAGRIVEFHPQFTRAERGKVHVERQS